MPLLIKGYDKKYAFKEAKQILTEVDLLDRVDYRISQLSGGQQQRVAIARCLVQKAKIILADEPIASLDPESARTVMEILAKINREHGITVLVSLHQVQFAHLRLPHQHLPVQPQSRHLFHLAC